LENSTLKGLEIGINGGQLVSERKRNIVVDTMGYIICLFIHAANIYGGRAGMKLLDKVFEKYQLKKIFVDGIYRGEERAFALLLETPFGKRI
jgi:putative transposase